MVENGINEFNLKFSSSERAQLFFDKLTLLASSPYFLEAVHINIEPDNVNIQEIDLSHAIQLKLHFPLSFFTTRITKPISVGILTNDLRQGTTAADKFMKLGENITLKILGDCFIFLGSTPHTFFKTPIVGISEPKSLKAPHLITSCASNVNLEDIRLILSLLDLISKDDFSVRIDYSSNGLLIQGENDQRSTKRRIRCREVSTEDTHTFIPKQSLSFLSKIAENSKNIEIGIMPEGVVHASMDFMDGAKCDLFMAPRVPSQE